MTDQQLIQLVRETVQVSLLMSAPLLGVALVVGVTVSIVQVVTSIQDMTLSFVPRIVAVFLVGLLLLPWMIEKVTFFTIRLITQFPMYTQ